MTTSSGRLEVGLITSGDRGTVADLEARPVDSLWVGGHVASRNPSPEPMQALARLVAVTERVRVGTAVLPLPLYPPALIAKQIADLDHASGGRLTLGVGVGGEYPQEFRAMQVPVAERGRRTDEAIPLLRELWTGEPVTHTGSFHAMRDVRIRPAPCQPGGPPILVAGRKEPATRRAGALGDGWLPYLFSPGRYASSVETVTAAAADAGRDLSRFEWGIFVFFNIEPDGRSARDGAARSMGATYDQDFTPMVDRVAAAGTAAQVASRVREFYDAGARHFVFCPATRVEATGPVLDRLFGSVVPALREHAAAR